MSNFKKLLVAQFLTAFADNAILWIAITWAVVSVDNHSSYVSALQASFLIAFVVLAPWVGAFADAHAKSKVLVIGNVVKLVGSGLMIFSIDPLIAYAIVGIGAAIYSPAKYGVIPELVDEKGLVKANGWVEGATIAAILIGGIVGAKIANESISAALWFVVALYVVSAIIAARIGPLQAIAERKKGYIREFTYVCKTLIDTRHARFALIGSALFWASAAVLRVALIAWAQVVLLISDTDKIAELTIFISIGIVIGSLLSAKVFRLENLRKTRFAAYAMGVCVLIFSQVDTVIGTWIILFLIGAAGGIFIVPINAAIQNIGHKTVGAGGTVATQNFFNNMAMLIASGLFYASAKAGISPIVSIFATGVLILLATMVIAMQLRKNQP